MKRISLSTLHCINFQSLYNHHYIWSLYISPLTKNPSYFIGIGRITYRIQEDGNITEIFEISYLTGLVQINNAPDFEVRKFYQFTVEASDNDGIVPKVSAAKVVVVVKDVNDNRPYFTETRGEVSIIESSASNRIVYTVSANDIDSVENGYVNYKIVEGNINDQFYINPYTGMHNLCRCWSTVSFLSETFSYSSFVLSVREEEHTQFWRLLMKNCCRSLSFICRCCYDATSDWSRRDIILYFEHYGVWFRHPASWIFQ